MESHILNSYHQARYRIHGHNRMGSTSESYSFESPEYPEKFAPQATEYPEEEASNEWKGNQNGDIKVSKKLEYSNGSSSDDDNVPVSSQSKPEQDAYDNNQSSEANEEYYGQELVVDSDDYEIVVDDDTPNNEGQIIQVYAVDPNLDLEASDEEQEQDYCISKRVAADGDGGEYVEEVDYTENTGYSNTISKDNDNLGINMDAPVVSNVDEYFIKEPQPKNYENILEVKDQSVISDVDEYFIKETKVVNPSEEEAAEPNVDDFFVKDSKVKKANELNIMGEVPNIDEFFIKVEDKAEPSVIKADTKAEIATVSNSTPDFLPHIENIKRFLLEDMPCPKFQLKTVQRSCSLPHSPAHFNYTDVADAKTSLSFEDLNIDLSVFTLDENKGEKSFVLSSDCRENRNDNIPRTLTDEDINSFLIKSKPDIERAFEDSKEDDLSHEDMEEIFCPSPVESKLEYSTTEKQLRKPIDNKVSSICTKVSTKEPVSPKISATSTPKAPKSTTVFDFCIEKPKPVFKKRKEIEVKVESDDFVDVESLNDTVIPVLEAYNVGSLFEQFEASEKVNINVRRKPPGKMEPDVKPKTNGLANGMRLKDAAVQLNKNKMRQILMPDRSRNSTVVKKSQTVHSDHDYCSPKKRHSLPVSLKKGQSLLKPEVLSSNNKILSSRHRACKNKKVDYNMSSDDETVDSNSKSKIKTGVKPNVNAPLFSNHRKKPPSSVSSVSSKEKCNNSVISNNASKASDNCSQSSSGSIKLTIKNKSKVILKIDCDDKQDSQQKSIKPSKPIKTTELKTCVSKPVESEKKKNEKHIKPIDVKEIEATSTGIKVSTDVVIKTESRPEKEDFDKIEDNNIGSKVSTDFVIKTESRPEKEDFYTALFKNKQDIQITIPEPVVVKSESDALDGIPKKEIVDFVTPIADVNIEAKPLKKKLNLQEYKLRREGVNSNGSSRTVSPEAIFPDMLGPHTLDKIQIIKSQISPNDGIANILDKVQIETPKKIFDPIKEASRKILANTIKKQKAEATRKRDEDIVMSKIPKVENLQLQPLISDAEMLKIVGMVPVEILLKSLAEKPKNNTEYEEIVLVSVGTNTDKAIFKQIKKTINDTKQAIETERKICKSPTVDNKSLINFMIKKSENVLKQNVFDSVKKDRSSDEKHEKRHVSPSKEPKIDKERYKDITAALKSVKRQVDTKILSNSLFASIQDTVMKKAPDDNENIHKKRDERRSNTLSPVEKKSFFESNLTKTIIVREYDTNSDHGEDKIILHLQKKRSKPSVSNMVIQTDPSEEFEKLANLSPVRSCSKPYCTKKRTVSDMSSSIGDSPIVKSNDCGNKKKTLEEKVKTMNKRKSEERTELKIEKRSRSIDRRSRSKDQRSRSKDRYESKYRRRSRSRSRRSRSRSRRPRRRSRSRSRSRSRGRSRSVNRYRRYRRSDSPYKPKKRSRSPYRRSSSRRSPPRKRDYHSNRTRSRSRNNSYRSKSPIAKKTKSISEKDVKAEKKLDLCTTPPSRKPALSESSDSSTSSGSSSSSDSSSSLSSDRVRSRSRSDSRRRSSSPVYRKHTNRSYSSEARECNTPVEERRIVFVGKLEKDVSKSHLRTKFSMFGPILEVTLHTKDDGCRYGFLTFRNGRDAWSAVESASCFPQYDVGFGGRRAFCRQRYADLDGLEAKYTESAYMGRPTMKPGARSDDLSFEQMLLEMKTKLSQRKKIDDPKP